MNKSIITPKENLKDESQETTLTENKAETTVKTTTPASKKPVRKPRVTVPKVAATVKPVAIPRETVVKEEPVVPVVEVTKPIEEVEIQESLLVIEIDSNEIRLPKNAIKKLKKTKMDIKKKELKDKKAKALKKSKKKSKDKLKKKKAIFN